jgi:propanol-preferring alcohol dehydrogenase
MILSKESLMKAMQFSSASLIESNPLAWTEQPEPVPGTGDVRLKVHVCAICRTDLHVIEGDLPPEKRPIIPGHQIVGVIDTLGPACTRLRVGMRVGAAWLRHTCGICRYCRAGRENLCPESRYTGYHADGGFARYAIVPEAFAYELPQELDDVHVAPLLCAGIIGFRALKRCSLPAGGTLAIFGFGSSAHIVLQLARHRGHDVYVVTRGQEHQRLARDLGAVWCGTDATNMPRKADAGIVFAPAGVIVPGALAALEPGGVLALAGIHMTPIPTLDYQTNLYGERDIHPVTANTREDGRELLTEAVKANVRPHITQYAMHDANRALQDLKAGRIDGTGVLIADDGS